MGAALKHLMRAESIIQRDAVMSALNAAGINAFSENRDISRKIADTTVDLAYEGYSAVFDGFIIQVNEADYEQAKPIADGVLKKASEAKPDPGLSEGSAYRRFYFCSLFSIVMPGLFHGLAIYHLIDGIRRGEKPHFGFFAVSALMLIVTGAVVFHFLYSTNIMDVLRSLADLL